MQYYITGLFAPTQLQTVLYDIKRRLFTATGDPEILQLPPLMVISCSNKPGNPQDGRKLIQSLPRGIPCPVLQKSYYNSKPFVSLPVISEPTGKPILFTKPSSKKTTSLPCIPSEFLIGQCKIPNQFETPPIPPILIRSWEWVTIEVHSSPLLTQWRILHRLRRKAGSPER